MIEIKCAAADTAAALCARADVEQQTVLVMTEREELLGFACMQVSGEEVSLTYLEAPDSALTDALLRAALNSARVAGAKTARVIDRSLCQHMEQKGYFAQTDLQRLEIASFFTKSACKA